MQVPLLLYYKCLFPLNSDEEEESDEDELDVQEDVTERLKGMSFGILPALMKGEQSQGIINDNYIVKKRK